MTLYRENPIALILTSAAALTGMSLVGISMHHGPGVGGDATIYLTTAENLAKGFGLVLFEPGGGTRLLPYFPPFFPLVLSFFAFLGLNLVQTALWLNILLFGLLVILVGVVTFSTTQSARLTGLICFAVALSPILMPVYSWAMSEPLAIWLGFLSLAVLWRFQLRKQGTALLILAGILAGLSFLTRYSAVAFIITGLLVLILNSDFKKLPVLIKRVVLYSVTALFPMLIWLVIDLTQTNTIASRSLLNWPEISQRLASYLPQLKEVLLFWLLPESLIENPPYPGALNTIFLVVVLIGLIITGVIVLRKNAGMEYSDRAAEKIAFRNILLIFTFVYLLVISGIYFLTYPPITIGSRMFAPAHIAVMWLLILSMPDVMRLISNRLIRVLIPSALVVFVAVYGVRSLRIVNYNFQQGLGYTAPAWRNSETIAAVRQLPDETILITNETNAVLFLTDRLSYPLQEIYADEPVSQFYPYGSGDFNTDPTQRQFVEEGAALVLFDSIDDQLAGLYHERTEERILSLVNGLQQAFRGSDGGIFYYDD